MINSNVWLARQGRRVDAIVRQMEVYRAKGSYGGDLNLDEIITMFNGAKAEIDRLQKELEASEARVKELDTQIGDIFKERDPECTKKESNNANNI